jgi:hypothetical protein
MEITHFEVTKEHLPSSSRGDYKPFAFAAIIDGKNVGDLIAREWLKPNAMDGCPSGWYEAYIFATAPKSERKHAGLVGPTLMKAFEKCATYADNRKDIYSWTTTFHVGGYASTYYAAAGCQEIARFPLHVPKYFGGRQQEKILLTKTGRFSINQAASFGFSGKIVPYIPGPEDYERCAGRLDGEVTNWGGPLYEPLQKGFQTSADGVTGRTVVNDLWGSRSFRPVTIDSNDAKTDGIFIQQRIEEALVKEIVRDAKAAGSICGIETWADTPQATRRLVDNGFVIKAILPAARSGDPTPGRVFLHRVL